jgi:hypothetical protein
LSPKARATRAGSTPARARDSLAFVVRAADRFGSAGQSLVDVARGAFVDGMQTALWVGAAVLAAGSVVTYLRRERGDG